VASGRSLSAIRPQAGRLRLLGRLHCATPRVPLVSGWVDPKVGVELLERAVALSDRDPRNPLFLAEALLDHESSRRCEAIALLREIAARSPSVDLEVEESGILAEARQRLDHEYAEAPCR